MATRKEKNFWTDLSRYGAVHRNRKEVTGEQRARCLLVFVHGLFGHCRKTWGQMPAWVLENAKFDMTVISYAYPSRSWHRCSIGQAADDLRAWLETEFRDYSHIIFITHSTGGLVVKSLLISAAAQLNNQEQDSDESDVVDSLWSRTRRVLNIAVPHFGGSRILSHGGKWVYQLYYFCLAPLFGCVRFVSQGNWDWGKNEIIPTLTWRNPWLLNLEKDFLAQLKRSFDSNQLTPTVQDIGAKSDLSVPYKLGEAKRRIYIRGTHKSIKIPKHVNAPIVSICSDLISQYHRNPGIDLVYCALSRIGLINRTLGTEHLISTAVSDSGKEQILPGISSSRAGTQKTIADSIITEVQKTGVKPRKLLITGAAGVGKTTVLRQICWRLGLNYLAAPKSNPLPLLIPLQQITASQVPDTNYTWDAMWQWWLNWGRSVDPTLDWDRDWLESHFLNRPVVVLLDGLDDFLQIHKSVGFSTFLNLLRTTESQYAENSNFTIVVGIRNTLHGIERLVESPKDIYEILRLSIEQAKQVYPSCKGWIEEIEDRELKDFILTPLILSNYEPDPNCQISAGPGGQSALLCQTVRTVLSRVGLVGKQVGSHEIEIDHLNWSMIAIAWLFFYKTRGEINSEVLRREAFQFHERWERFFSNLEEYDGLFYLETIAPEKESILYGFSLAADPQICEDLLQRSLFLPTGAGTVRFRHRHWQEFLLGQYLALCIRMHNFEELGIAAFHSRIYRMAGDSFGERIVTEGCIKELLKVWSQSRNSFVSGNVIAFLTWTQTAIEPQALRLLLSKLDQFESLSRLVLLGGLGYRVLINQEKDLSLIDIRRALLPRFQEFADPQASPVDDPAACSLSWMYQKAFAGLFDLEEPKIPWPGLDFNDDETRQGLPMVCTVENGEYILDERSKSLQIAFLVPIMDTFNDPRLAIRAIHYLYYLIVARKHGVHFVGISRELPTLLAEGCEFQAIVESFHWAPQLCTFYKRCQQYHARLDSESIQME